MTDQNQQPPAKDFDQEVQAAMEKVREAKAAKGMEIQESRPLLERPLVIGVVASLFLAVCVWNVMLLKTPPAPLSPQAEADTRVVSLFVVSQVIDQFKAEHGRLPQSLEEVGMADQGFAYRPVGDEYELTPPATTGLEAFKSTDDPLSLLEQIGAAGEGGRS